MEEISDENDLEIPRNTLSKLALTLFIAQVLQSENNGYKFEYDTKVFFKYNPQEALLRIHSTYLAGIKHDDFNAHFEKPAIAMLLFDSEDNEAIKKVEEVLEYYQQHITQLQARPRILKLQNKSSAEEILQFLEEIFKKNEEKLSKGKITQQLKLLINEQKLFIDHGDLDFIIQMMAKSEVLQPTKDGVTNAFSLNKDWRNYLIKFNNMLDPGMMN